MAVIIPPDAVIPVPTLSVPTVDTPVELKLPATLPVTLPVKLPSNIDDVTIPTDAKMALPTVTCLVVTFSDLTVFANKVVVVVTPSVVIPLTFKFPLAVTLPFVTPNPDNVGFPPTCS